MGRQAPADTPLMRQYLDVKGAHPDAIVFFRLGDFYEMFFEDAVLGARLLDLTLTTRDKGRDDAVPMCGVPHHAARGYIARLTELGHKIVLCEQVEDPRLARGLVRREVVRVITPGVVVDEEVLDPKAGRYLAAVVSQRDAGRGAGARFGLAYLDVSTGEFRATEADGVAALAAELARVAPRELLAAAADLAPGGALAPVLAPLRQIARSPVEPPGSDESDALLRDLLGPTPLAPLAARAAAMALRYARATQPSGTLPITRLVVHRAGEAVVLDEAAVANLEIVNTLLEGGRRGSLLGAVDQTVTAPGGRLLRRWLLFPLTEVAAIRRRHDAVEHLVGHATVRASLREELGRVHDLERLAARVSLGVATPRDVGALRASLERLPRLAALVAPAPAPGGGLAQPELLAFAAPWLAELAEVAQAIAAALVDEPPPIARDGGFIRPGHCAVVDEQRRLADGGKEAIAAIESRERERTGISSLKVRYNRVFGYYIEVNRSQAERVPQDYARKQTIATGERFVTPELADLEARVLGAHDKLVAREAELFAELCRQVARRTGRLAAAAGFVARLDVCAALAEVAQQRGYVRPEVDDGDLIDIVDGRHPVVEQAVPAGAFVPNDCRLDPGGEQILLITGPNMAGKSTYMRQVAQIVLLAQAGSFVPARAARVGCVDRIFTRVGAADNLARGESTFMVEMRETAAILAGATRRSLVVLDEVGRGTSTFDGVSIAWAVTEHLHERIGARTLFATHYHELCALADALPRLRNLSVAVREHRGEVVFLRQVVAGPASRSYGIDVARLAGLPQSVVARARAILAQLEGGGRPRVDASQLALFAAAMPAPDPSRPDPDAHDARAQAVLGRLRAIDPERTTPFEALALLAELRSLAT